MIHFIPLTQKDISALITTRKSETKVAKYIKLPPISTNIYEGIKTLDVDYVIFGIAEDIGVYANKGRNRVRKIWHATLQALLNMQANDFINIKRVAILGSFECLDSEIFTPKPATKKTISKARKIVEDIDKKVTYLISVIVQSGKVPIIIGSGQNNSYGNIKGTALALNQKINVVNFDAHTDFRSKKGRHNNNGFSYAYAEGFLKRYFIFGIHENFTSEKEFKTIEKLKDIQFHTFEAIKTRVSVDYKKALSDASNFIISKPFGIEIDCGAIKNINSITTTPTGLSVTQTRKFIHYFGQNKNVKYLHICEAAPKKKSINFIGKLVSTLIMDFIKAQKH